MNGNKRDVRTRRRFKLSKDVRAVIDLYPDVDWSKVVNEAVRDAVSPVADEAFVALMKAEITRMQKEGN